MGNLIKLDLVKILRDKLFLVMAILSLAISLFYPAIYKLIEVLALEAALDAKIEAKLFAFLTFSPTGGAGLMVTIFMPIILHKEYSNGVLRNKLIYGKSRPQIYLSLLLSSFIIAFGVLLISSLITFSVSLLMFNYSNTPVDVASDIATYALSLLFEVLIWIFVVGLSNFFSIALNNVALAIVIPIVSGTVLALFGALLTSFAPNTTFREVVSYINIYYLIEYIGIGKYTTAQILALSITPVVYSAIFIGFGFMIFSKKDIK